MGLCGTSFLLLCLVACVLCAHAEPYARPHLVVGGGPHPPPSPQDSEGAQSSYSRRSALQVLTPQQIMAAYGITYSATAGSGKIIAIIDAFNCSTCEADLAKFNTQYSLPACTTANGCFHKVSQTGSTTSLPADDTTSNWGFEAAMDIQAAHAMAPGAKKYLIVANSASFNDLFAAVKYAVITLKASVISMSWGGTESSSVASAYDSYFGSTPAFASTGDNGSGGGIEYPSSSSVVIAVGGTSLYTNSGTFSSEVAWSGSGGGCSAYTTAIPAQLSYATYGSTGCGGKKALPDTSLLADPNSGLKMYYSGLYNGAHSCTPPNCWYGGGGTSLAAPLLAARAAARGILTTPASVYTGGYTYRDITSGNNGGHTATTGEDLVTGVGSLMN